MFRFDSKKALYFYPDTENDEDKVLFLNKGSSYENDVKAREDVCLVKHGLKIPQHAHDYADFVRQIKLSEELFSNSL